VHHLIAFDDLVTGITAPSSQLSYPHLPYRQINASWRQKHGTIGEGQAV
jgi:hypothetical protein